MADNTLPEEWEGKPTKYHFFDGFTQAGLFGKLLYLATVPGLVIPLLMEAYRYNVETRNGKKAEAFLAAQEHRPAPPSLSSLFAGPDEKGTKFQDSERAKAAAMEGRAL